MHLVKALQPTTAEDITGELVSWNAQQVRPVQEDMVNWYKARSTVFEYVGFKDFSADGLGALNFDSNGNLLANIIPRTDTYAGLVTSAISGGGEIASATDRPTIVKFHGAAGAGTAYEFSPLAYGRIGTSGTSTSISDSIGGGVSIQSVSGSIDNGFPGPVNIYSGNGHVSADADGGNIQISAGSGGGFGAGGSIDIRAGSCPEDHGYDGIITLTSPNGQTIMQGSSGEAAGGVSINKASVGFFNKLTVQPDTVLLTSAGTKVAVGGLAVNTNDTFTGGIGTSAYTIPQIVKALKLLGLLAE